MNLLLASQNPCDLFNVKIIQNSLRQHNKITVFCEILGSESETTTEHISALWKVN